MRVKIQWTCHRVQYALEFLEPHLILQKKTYPCFLLPTQESMFLFSRKCHLLTFHPPPPKKITRTRLHPGAQQLFCTLQICRKLQGHYQWSANSTEGLVVQPMVSVGHSWWTRNKCHMKDVFVGWEILVVANRCRFFLLLTLRVMMLTLAGDEPNQFFESLVMNFTWSNHEDPL